jgi:hypothetical protein
MSFVAACSSGECPRALIALRTWRFRPSIAFVLRMKGGWMVSVTRDEPDALGVLGWWVRCDCLGQGHRGATQVGQAVHIRWAPSPC